MADTARAEIDLPSTCAKCGGSCELDRDFESTREKTRLRCTACSHVVEIAMVAAAAGKWTLVDPDGKTSHFSSWQELMIALPGSGTSIPATREGGLPSTRTSSAAALLDVTPAAPSTAPKAGRAAVTERAGRLSLVGGEEPPLPGSAVPHIEEPRVEKTSEETIEEVPDEDVLPASEESKRALARAHMTPRVSMPPPLPPGASMRPGAAVVLSVAPPPPPPKGGTLRTLPPPDRRHAPAPPPPTIDVKDDDSETITVGSDKETGTPDENDLPAKKPGGGGKTARVAEKEADERESDTKRRAAPVSLPPPPPLAGSGRGWIVPGISVAVLVIGIWYMTRTPAAVRPGEGASAPSASGASNDPQAAVTAANTTTSPLASNAPPTPSASTPSDPRTATSEAGADPAEKRPIGDMQLTLPEVLERAAAARKNGDPTHARALLERALELSPGNAEAYGLLADLARSQGDNAGAKAGYEKALATSPSYLPALLGLADTQWDLGERDAAQRHYAAIVALGRPVAERVKERATPGGGGGGGGGGTASPPSTAPTAPIAPASTEPTTAPAATTPPATTSPPSPTTPTAPAATGGSNGNANGANGTDTTTP